MSTKSDRLPAVERTGRRRTIDGPERVIASGRGRLRPKARLIRTLGAELISSEVVAVLELVRNSYDADATLVEVIFEDPHLPPEARLEIRDNGHGMTRDILLGPWLEPATAFKAPGSAHRLGGDRSPKGRRRLGSKGVGRFATQRLGHSLQVVTTEGGTTELRAEFDWVRLDHPDSYLDQLSVPWRELRLPPRTHRGRKGTSLFIRGLRDIWTEERFDRLRLALSRLLGPGLGSHPPFRIELIINGARERIQPALEALAPMYCVSGEVRSSGLAVMRYTDLSGVTEDWERSVHWPPVGVACGPFSFEVKAWDLDKPALIPFLKKTGIAHGLRDFRRLIREHSGISLYRDGFRILPYGEPDNDWLRLDRRRVNNPTVRLSNNQILGSVNIAADRNPLLQDQTNREGLVSNEAYLHLQHVVVELLSYLENRRFHARRTLGVGAAAPLRRTALPLFDVAEPEATGDLVSTSSAVTRWAATGYLMGMTHGYSNHLARQIGTELDHLTHEIPTLWGGAELDTAIRPSVHRARVAVERLLQTRSFIPSASGARNSHNDRSETLQDRLAKVLDAFAERVARLDVTVCIRGVDNANQRVLADFEIVFALILGGTLDALENGRKPKSLDVTLRAEGVSVSCNSNDIRRELALETSVGMRLARSLAGSLGLTITCSAGEIDLRYSSPK